MPEMSDPNSQVLVVGAGPTGLLLAAELERRGVPCLLIDALDAPRGWDRATVVHARSMEIFEALGLEDRLLAEGVAQLDIPPVILTPLPGRRWRGRLEESVAAQLG